MKVVITTDSYFPTIGGAEVYAYQLAKFLKKNGHEVTIFTPELRAWKNDEEISTLRVAFSRNPRRLINFIRVYYELLRSADVVHSIYSHKLAAIGAMLRFFSPKTMHVISLQGMGILDLPGNTFLYQQLHSFYRWVSLKRAHLIVASCKEFVEIANRYVSEKKIVYLPNLVDIDEFTRVSKDYTLLPFKYKNQPLVFTIRRLVPKNGIQFLIETVPKILKENKNVQFVLLGWGRLEKYLKKRARELGVEKNVHFLGRIENYNLKKYLNLADIVVFPSTAESTSIACLESMSLEKPIVASKVGGYMEMVVSGQNGFLVNLTDNENSDYGAPMDLSDEKKEDLAQAITNLIENKEKRIEFGQNSRKRIEENFTWQKHINTIIGFYEKFKHEQS